MTELSKKSGPKDVFLHVLAFGALYVSIVAFLTLIFQYINFTFPDPISFFKEGILSSIRTSTSILIIIFPVFLIISSILEKDFIKDPSRRDLKFRKWLVYLTLFVAAVTVIVDLILLVNGFYGGELTIKFFLKTISVLAVAAGVFAYYHWDLKRKDKSEKIKKVAWIVISVVAASIIAGFFIIGSPSVQRDQRLDGRRVSDLQNIQNQVVNFWSRTNTMPESLEVLEKDSGFIPIDPETDENYEYRVLGSSSFELCAEFSTENIRVNSKEVGIRVRIPFPEKEVFVEQNWNHEAGRVCFERNIGLQIR